jgi:hypothetical protein
MWQNAAVYLAAVDTAARGRMNLLKRPFSGTVSYSVQIPLSKVEELLFSLAGDSLLLTHFRFEDGHINLHLAPVSTDQEIPERVLQATFESPPTLVAACACNMVNFQQLAEKLKMNVTDLTHQCKCEGAPVKSSSRLLKNSFIDLRGHNIL